MRKTKYAMTLLLALALACLSGVSAAEILPPRGMGQVGFQAVVLCRDLTVRESRSASSKAVAVLHAGNLFITQGAVDGWCDCFLSEDGGRTGWIKADYVAVDPAWYKAEKSTPVYPWDAEGDIRVGLLEAGEEYPVLMARDEWVVIGLRGASGWICDPQGAREALKAVFTPDRLRGVVRAELTAPDGNVYSLTDGEKLQWIGDHFSNARRVMGTGCSFDAVLRLTLADGDVIPLTVATDSCCVFITEKGAHYNYGLDVPGESSAVSRAFWALFGLDPADFYR